MVKLAQVVFLWCFLAVSLISPLPSVVPSFITQAHAAVSPPVSVRSAQGDGYLRVAWELDADSTITSSNIYRSTDGQTFVKVSTVPFPTKVYDDVSVQSGATYYYKITSVDTTAVESGFSPVTASTYHYLQASAFISSVSSAVSVGDLNGDGKPDIALGYPDAYTSGKGKNSVYAGKVDIYLGGTTPGTLSKTFIGERNGDKFGYSLALADLNNDIRDELIIGAPHYDTTVTWPFTGTAKDAGKLYIFAGSQLLPSSPAFTVDGAVSFGCGGGCIYYTMEEFGFAITPAEDVDGDGYKDVAIGAPYGGLDRGGSVKFLYGGPVLEKRLSEIRGSIENDHMGYTVASVGDANGDGFAEVVAGAPTGDNYVNGKIYLVGWTSRVGPLMSTPGVGYSVAGLDINGDGTGDVVAGTASSAAVLYGSPVQDVSPDITLNRPATTVASLGDVNRDGFDDLVLDGPAVLFGSASGENMIAMKLAAPLKVIGVGDVDGDGIREIIATDSAKTYICSFISLKNLPEITLASDVKKITVTSPNLTLKGQVKGNVTRLLVGGREMPLLPDGSFKAALVLSEGLSIVEVIAVNSDGRVAKRVVEATYVAPAPLTVTITSPAADSSVKATPVAVTGTANNTLAMVTVNGAGAALSGTNFQSTLELVEGINVIEVNATDIYNQNVSESITITLLSRGSVTGVVTDSGSTARLPDVTVSVSDYTSTVVTATDWQGAYVAAGLREGNISAYFSKSGYIPQIKDGSIIAGQTQALDVQLVPAPVLALSVASPVDKLITNTSPITVNGVVSNNAHVTVNSVEATVSNGAFSASVPLVDGDNTVTISATDPYGQVNVQTRTVTLLAKGSLSGKIVDSFSGIPLAAATVTVTDSTNAVRSTLSASDGSYVLADIPAGSITCVVAKDGYLPQSFDVFISPGQAMVRDSALDRLLPAIANVTISAVTTDSATISWTTDVPTNGTVEFGPTIGYGGSASDGQSTVSHSVTLSGLSQATSYHFRVVATNGYGFSTASVDQIFTTLNPIAVAIISPANGSTILRPDVMVRGTVENSTGNETGITVNGVVATVYGNEFFVNHLPLQEGENTITVTATDPAGNSASASVTVTASPSANYISITATPDSGIVPFEGKVRVDGSFSITSPVSLSCAGPAAVEFIPATDGLESGIRMNSEGVYLIGATAAGPDGQQHEDTVAVIVQNAAQLDGLLRAKWNGMKTALAAKNIEAAVADMNPGTATAYREFYTLLYDQLPVLVAAMEDIELINASATQAQYRIHRNETVNGVVEAITYYIYYTKNQTGIWQIERY